MGAEVVAGGATAWQPPVPRRGWVIRVGALAAVGFLLGAVVAVAVLAYGTWTFARDHEGLLLPGTVIAGVDVSGLRPRDAVAAVEEQFGPALDHVVTLRWEDQEWTLSARAAGVVTDAQAAVADAVAAAGSVSWPELVAMRWQAASLGFERDVRVSYPQQAAYDLAQAVAGVVDQEARDATMTWDSGWPLFTTEQVGRAVPVDVLADHLYTALRTGVEAVTVPVQTDAPATTLADLHQVLLVREADQRLYYYEDGVLTRDWQISTGTGRYPTPGGEFVVGAKRYLPTWTNPAPNGWGRGMPTFIGPGIRNPLGLRALNWDTPDGGLTAIRFHGTQAVGQLGRPASHGCVRLSNADVIELYDLIETGARIISVRA